jgi:hypothetical protein
MTKAQQTSIASFCPARKAATLSRSKSKAPYPSSETILDRKSKRIPVSSCFQSTPPTASEPSLTENATANCVSVHEEQENRTVNHKPQVTVEIVKPRPVELPLQPSTPTRQSVLTVAATPTEQSILIPATPDRIKGVSYQPYSSPFSDTLSTALPLPKPLELLGKFHFALDQVCLFHQSRQQLNIFDRLLKPIENICKRTITESHFRRLYTLIPECYHVQPYNNPPFPRSLFIDMKHHGNESKSSNEGFTQSELDARRALLHGRILEIVKDKHEKWCKGAGQDTPPPKHLIRKWHPKFDQDSVEIDIIPEASFPWDKPAAEIVKEEPSKKSIKPITESNTLNTSSTEPINTASPFGVSSKLLERIRAKERQSVEQVMLGKTSTETLERKLSKLATLVDSLSFLFHSCKKNVMSVEEICKKLVESSRVPISAESIRDQIQSLISVAPDWISILTSSDAALLPSHFVKLNRSVSVSVVKDTILKSEK